MNLLASIPLLADLPDPAGYVSVYKVGTVIVLTFVWGLCAQWVDRDTDVVKTRREHWNLIVLSGGLVAYFVLFVPPWSGVLFFVGLGFWLLIAGGSIVFYVLHRNGRVVPDARVMTAQHLKRLISGGSGEKKIKDDKGMRVRLHDFNEKFVERPGDPEEYEGYRATQDFLYDVLWRRAADVDVLAGKEKYRVVYHIDGVAIEQPEGLPPEEGEKVFRFLKKIAGLNIEEIRRPQSGRIQAALLSHNGEAGTTVVRTSGTTAGERLRLNVQAGPTLLRLQELGLAAPRLDKLREVLQRPQGLFIVSAPPRSGATTTEYAILKGHDAYIHNIHSLERRRLLELDNVTQQEYDGANTDVDYARKLQTILRREPDIVLVSDCEDRETAQLAARAGSEERKIYVGMQARDVFDALASFVKLVEDNAMVADCLLGISNQRLIRKLCPECREAYKPDEKTLRKLNLPVDKIERFYRPPTDPPVDKRGRPIVCPNCQGTGYVGRTGMFEILIIDDAVRKLIAEGAPVKTIKAQARKNKMYYLQEEGLLKVIDGTTSMNEILRVLRNDK